MKNYKGLLVSGILMVFIAPGLSKGSTGGRGGIPEAMTVNAFKKYVEGEGLKLSVRHYAETLDLSEVNDPADKDVKPLLANMLVGGALLKDINLSQYVAGIDNCKLPGDDDSDNPEAANPKVRAWTHTGANGIPNIGGKICFDVDDLVKDYISRGIDLQTAALEMSALTFHETYHHFQNAVTENSVQRASLIKQQEDEATSVGGFVLKYFGFESLPLLKFLPKPKRVVSGITPDTFITLIQAGLMDVGSFPALGFRFEFDFSGLASENLPSTDFWKLSHLDANLADKRHLLDYDFGILVQHLPFTRSKKTAIIAAARSQAEHSNFLMGKPLSSKAEGATEISVEDTFAEAMLGDPSPKPAKALVLKYNKYISQVPLNAVKNYLGTLTMRITVLGKSIMKIERRYDFSGTEQGSFNPGTILQPELSTSRPVHAVYSLFAAPRGYYNTQEQDGATSTKVHYAECRDVSTTSPDPECRPIGWSPGTSENGAICHWSDGSSGPCGTGSAFFTGGGDSGGTNSGAP